MAAGWNARGRPWRGAPDPEETRLATQLVATLTTSLGDIEVELFPDHAPKTVANFVELAEGTREWTDPQTRSRHCWRLRGWGSVHSLVPSASSTKFATVLGAWSGKSSTSMSPSEVVSVATSWVANRVSSGSGAPRHGRP